MQEAGMLPIITHPERNQLLQSDPGKVGPWVKKGCLIQITAHSLLGRFGKLAKDIADQFIRMGVAHIVASDAHGSVDRTPILSEAHRYVASTYGAEDAKRLFVRTPQATLQGKPFEQREARSRNKTKWYQFSAKRVAGAT